MNTVEMWQVLEIEPTKDEQAIVAAYRAKVVTVNPEDDAEGFMRLRDAFEMAMKYAKEDDVLDDDGGKPESEKTDIDRHIDKLNDIYMDIFQRINIDNWSEWLSDPLCIELDTADEMREATLVFIMSHFMIPFEAWKLLDETFSITDDQEVLKEKFPEDFINFVLFRIKYDDFVDYDAFLPREHFEEVAARLMVNTAVPERPSRFEADEYASKEDSYIRAISTSQANILAYMQKLLDREKEDYVPEDDNEIPLDIVCNVLEYARNFDIIHPIEIGAMMRVFELTGDLTSALNLARAVLYYGLIPFHRYATPTAAYLLLKYLKEGKYYIDDETGEKLIEDDEEDKIIGAAHAAIEEAEQRDTDNAMMLLAKCYFEFIQRDYSQASDTVIEVLDGNQKNSEAIIILKKISKEAIEYYEKKREQGTISEDEKLELSWSYFRTENVDPIIPILDTIEPNDKLFYGYNNLYGRCYSANEEFDKAEPYLKKWTEMMDDMKARYAAGEQLSKKDMGRINRGAFCYFMYGQCLEHLERYEEAEHFYKKSIDVAFDEDQDINEELYYRESLGKMYLNIKDYNSAMEVWNAMIERVDHCVPAYIHRQETAHLMRDAQLVIDDYYNIIRDFPGYGKAYGLAAKVFLIYKQIEDAEKVIEKADEAEIESDSLDWMRARLWEMKGDLEDAETIYLNIHNNIEDGKTDIDGEDLIDFYSDLTLHYLNRRDENDKRNRLDDASVYLQKGFSYDAKNKRLLWLQTDLEEYLGESADATYKHMLELFPEDDTVFYEYGEYLKRNDRDNEALDMYMKARDLNPDHKRVNNRLMEIWLDRFNDSEKKVAYDKAVDFATRQLELVDDEYYRVERLLLYLDGGESGKAEEDARVAIEHNPDNVYGHNGLGLALLRERRYDEAIESFKKAIEVMDNKETPVPYVNLARCYEQTGKYPEAITTLKKGIEIFGITLNNKYMLARLHVKNRNFEDALKLYEEMHNYYKERLKSTGNKWNAASAVKYLIKMVDVAILSGNDQLVQTRLSVLNGFLRDEGYTNKGLDEVTKGNERRVAADIFRQLGDFYVNNMRQYKTAIEYFEKCVRFHMPSGSKGPTQSIVDDSGFKGLFKRTKPNVYVEKPENIEGADLKELGDMYRFFAYACFNYGLKDWARDLATRSYDCYSIFAGRNIENYLAHPTSAPLRLSDVATVLYLMGKTAEARQMNERAANAPTCDFCTYGFCYDTILTLARFFEMVGDIPKAIEYYKRAFDNTRDDAEIYVALRTLDGNRGLV